MQHKGGDASQGDGDAPHGAGVHVEAEFCVSPGPEHANDQGGVQALHDAVVAHDEEEDMEKSCRLIGEAHAGNDKRPCCQDGEGADASEDDGENNKVFPILLSPFDVAEADFLADHDGGGAGDTEGDYGGQLSRDHGHRLGRHGVGTQMTDDGRIGRIGQTPEHLIDDDGETVLQEISHESGHLRVQHIAEADLHI